MLANVGKTYSISQSFAYARAIDAPEKGGRVVRSNCLIPGMSFEMQMDRLQNLCSSKFAIKAYTIVVSHSVEDREKIENLQNNEPEQLEVFLDDFLNELSKKNIDLAHTPFVICEHRNTDCLHYHILLLSTKFDGSRIDAGYLGKKSSIAAALTSEKFGLHGPKKLLQRDIAFKKYEQNTQNNQSSLQPKKRKRRSNDQIKFDAERKKKRKLAIEEAKKRKEKIRRVLLDAISTKTKTDFLRILTKNDLKLAKIQNTWVLQMIGENRFYRMKNLGFAPDEIKKIHEMFDHYSWCEEDRPRDLHIPTLPDFSENINFDEGGGKVADTLDHILEMGGTGQGGISSGGGKGQKKKKKKGVGR